MKRVIIALLAIQLGTMSFLNAGLFGELYKIPDLLEHLRSHHEDCITFLMDHYWGDDANDNDHASFPFQNTTGAHIVMCMPLIWKNMTTRGECIQQKYLIPRKVIFLDTYVAIGVWQPPSVLA